MSLSDRGKKSLRACIEGPRNDFGKEADVVFMKMGPAGMVDHLITNLGQPDCVAELKENREEAERYVAGLLGMM